LSLQGASRQRIFVAIDAIRTVTVRFMTIAERPLTHAAIVDGPEVRP
jgi:hypothetical protein